MCAELSYFAQYYQTVELSGARDSWTIEDINSFRFWQNKCVKVFDGLADHTNNHVLNHKKKKFGFFLWCKL